MLSKFASAQLEEAERAACNFILASALSIYLRDNETAKGIVNINKLLLRRFLGLYKLPEIRYLVAVGASHFGIVKAAKQIAEEMKLKNVSIDVAYDASSREPTIELLAERKAVEAVRKKLGVAHWVYTPDQQIDLPFTPEELDRLIIVTLMGNANPYTTAHADNLRLLQSHSALASQFSRQGAEELARTYAMFRPGTLVGQRDAIDYRLRQMNLPRLPRTAEDVSYVLRTLQNTR
jgi:hypothetical protein